MAINPYNVTSMHSNKFQRNNEDVLTDDRLFWGQSVGNGKKYFHKGWNTKSICQCKETKHRKDIQNESYDCETFLELLNPLTDHTIITTDSLCNTVTVLIPRWYADNYSKLSFG